MRFKVGDRVRYDRKFLVYIIQTSNDLYYTGIEWFEIIQINWEEVRSEDWLWFVESNLELVPEEPRFEYGELIEVRLDEWAPWVKRPFIYFEKWNAKYPYITANITKKQFDEWKKFDFQAFKNARKLKAQLTRREIAEKFWVAEDFRLLD